MKFFENVCRESRQAAALRSHIIMNTNELRCPQCHKRVPVTDQAALVRGELKCPSCETKIDVFEQPTELKSAIEAVAKASSTPLAIPGYTVHEIIGAGGMGVVYRATQTIFGRDVAVKVLSTSLSRQPEFEERFQREGRSIASLGSHTNIVQVFDQGVAGDDSYLIMEYVAGPHGKPLNLKQFLAGERLSLPEIVTILDDVAAALELIHSKGFCHRDVKPQNVLVDQNRRAKLTDFGIVGMLDGQATQALTTSIMGAWAYMSPERLHDPKIIGPSIDIYSLGVIAYEALAGRMPPQHKEPRPSAINPALPPLWDELCCDMLDEDPAARLSTATEFRRRLKAIHQPPSIETGPTSKCHSCGFVNVAAAQFCVQCGKRQSIVNAVQPTLGSNSPPTDPPRRTQPSSVSPKNQPASESHVRSVDVSQTNSLNSSHTKSLTIHPIPSTGIWANHNEDDGPREQRLLQLAIESFAVNCVLIAFLLFFILPIDTAVINALRDFQPWEFGNDAIIDSSELSDDLKTFDIDEIWRLWDQFGAHYLSIALLFTFLVSMQFRIVAIMFRKRLESMNLSALAVSILSCLIVSVACQLMSGEPLVRIILPHSDFTDFLGYHFRMRAYVTWGLWFFSTAVLSLTIFRYRSLVSPMTAVRLSVPSDLKHRAIEARIVFGLIWAVTAPGIVLVCFEKLFWRAYDLTANTFLLHIMFGLCFLTCSFLLISQVLLWCNELLMARKPRAVISLQLQHTICMFFAVIILSFVAANRDRHLMGYFKFCLPFGGVLFVAACISRYRRLLLFAWAERESAGHESKGATNQ